MLSSESDIILLSETWLSPYVESAEYFDHNYDVFLCNGGFRGRGVLVAVKSNYFSKNLNLSSPVDEIDLVGVKVYIDDTYLNVLAVYIPPATSASIYESLFDYLEKSVEIGVRTIISGDFNVPDFKAATVTSSVKGSTRSLFDFIQYNSLSQTNSVANKNDRLLDLVLCSSDVKTTVRRHQYPLVEEDQHHPTLLVSVSIIQPQRLAPFVPEPRKFFYNFKKSDLVTTYATLNFKSWDELYNTSDVDHACDVFYRDLKYVIDSFVPMAPANSNVFPKWYSIELISIIKKKNRFRKLFKNTRLQYYADVADDLRKVIKRQTKKDYSLFIKNTECNIRKDPNKLWSFIDAKKNKTRIPGKMCQNDRELTSPTEIVEGFARHFGSTFAPLISCARPCEAIDACNQESINNCVHPDVCDNININNSYTSIFNCDKFNYCDNVRVLHNFSVTASEVIAATKNLKPNLTAGSDDIPAFLVKDCIHSLSQPLAYLYNLILRSSSFPACWKIAKVCPVFKSGSKTDVSNYRPIALICNFAKIFERLLAKILCHHIAPYIVNEQHGFVKGKSTCTNLLEFTQYISNGLDNGEQIDVIYTDLSKAFDVVNHGLLLQKLSRFGLCNDIVSFFKSFLYNRYQFVA
jgi:hypothetical protein